MIINLLSTNNMTSYTMSKPPFDWVEFMKKVAIMTAILIFCGFWMHWSAQRMQKVMAVDYCWDSNGEHYEAPNQACR